MSETAFQSHFFKSKAILLFMDQMHPANLASSREPIHFCMVGPFLKLWFNSILRDFGKYGGNNLAKFKSWIWRSKDRIFCKDRIRARQQSEARKASIDPVYKYHLCVGTVSGCHFTQLWEVWLVAELLSTGKQGCGPSSPVSNPPTSAASDRLICSVSMHPCSLTPGCLAVWSLLSLGGFWTFQG